MEESYEAEQKAELERAAREKATKEADIIVASEIERRKVEIEAAAAAAQKRLIAQGEADAIFAKMEAEAKGIEAILVKQATGFAQIVNAAGNNATDAMKLMLTDKLEQIAQIQVEAIKNIKIDKVTVWDGAGGKDGNTSTANFLSGLVKSVPPLSDVMNMAGLSLPDYLGKKIEDKPATTPPIVQLKTES